MKINNINIFYKNNLIFGDIEFNNRIKYIKIKNKTEDKEALYLIPRFFDTHTHGGYGIDFNNIYKYSYVKIKKYIKKVKNEGIDKIFITTVTDKLSNLKRIALFIKKLIKKFDIFFGWHLEGPFINKEKSGAHDPNLIIPININFLKWLKRYCNFPIMITFAPEVKNNLEIANMFKNDFYWSIGHSIANAEIMKMALNYGFNRITHLCNGMNDLNHKYKNETIVNFALTRNIYSEIITDLIHVNESTLNILSKVINKNNIFIVSDSLSNKGLKNGFYSLGNIPIVKRNNVSYLEKSNILAGSSAKYNFLFKKMLNINHNILDLILYSSINAYNYFSIKNKEINIKQVANFILINNKGDIKAIYENGKRIR